mmetsp:Transcript_39234/g.108041  ORF Transcript_39234/g.108041 Transcript_39234/m.108041 type:complete len:521 (+) Transcript_39234:87-1649(+)
MSAGTPQSGVLLGRCTPIGCDPRSDVQPKCASQGPKDLELVETSAETAAIHVVKKVPRLRVMCVSVPESGHLIPTANVAMAMARRGHQTQLISCACARSKLEAQCRSAGCEFVGVAEHVEAAESGRGRAAELQSQDRMAAMFMYYSDEMRDPLRAAIRSSRPDVVVVDFITPCGWEVADEFGIPVVVEVPSPLQFVPSMLKFDNPWDAILRRLRLGKEEAAGWQAILDGCRKVWYSKPCLVNTFFGLERPQPLRPNIVVTGTTALRGGAGEAVTETSFPLFNEWLEWVRAEGLKVVYVTMGSMQELQPFQVTALYEGLAKVPGCAVAWSLKENQQRHLPSGGVQSVPRKFFVHKWLPQAEALNLPEVALVITHCGWGGLNETIAAGKPIVATPFRVDQPGNAALAKARGFCEVLDTSRLSADAVEQTVERVLRNPSYAACAKELQAALLKTGGVDTCVETVEFIAEHGHAEIVSEPPQPEKLAGRFCGPVALLSLSAAMFAFGVACARMVTPKAAASVAH